MRPVEMTGIVNRTTDFAQVRQNEEQKPVAEQYTFQAQFDKNVEKNSETVVPRHCKMSINVAMDGEVRSRSSWEINPLDSSLRSASSSCVNPFMTLSCFILCPISTFTSHIASI